MVIDNVLLINYRMKNIKMLEINQLINLQKKSIVKSIIIIAKIEINLHIVIKIIKNNKIN